jgi:hypothetical protein
MAARLEGKMVKDRHSRRVVQVEPTRVVKRRSSDLNVADDALVAAALRFLRNHVL